MKTIVKSHLRMRGKKKSVVKKYTRTIKKKKCPTGKAWDPRTRKCVPCPGGKIRSQGLGRGLGIGRGKGPIGFPIGRRGRFRR